MTGALVRMRLAGYLRSGRVLAPTLAGMIVIATLYGGGPAQAGEAYGLSSFALVPVLAWQTKMLLDTEPEVARHLAIVAVGRRRETAAALASAAVVALVTVVLAITLPWLVGGIEGPRLPADPPLITGIALGVWAHLLAIGPSVALGALSSRAITRTAGVGALTLVGGSVVILVLGLRGSPVPWLGPPLVAVARAAASAGRTSLVVGLTFWELIWAAVAVVGYVTLRRIRP